MSCPVCNTEKGNSWKYSDDISGAWIQVESGWSCDNCDYSEDWSYGVQRYEFGDYIFGYAYNTPQEQIDEVERLVAELTHLHTPTFGLMTVLQPLEEVEIPF